MSRTVKHLGARQIAEDETKVLMLVPFGPGEKISQIDMDCYFASGADSSIDQPSQCNWYGITIPWSLVFATNMMDGGGLPNVMTGVPEYDNLYAQWLKDVGDNAGEVFGGDADSDVESVTGEEVHADEELLGSGPIGVHKWFSREVIMRPGAAEGNNVIRFGDDFRQSRYKIPGAAMGGIVIFGMVRFQTDVETNFNIEMDDTTSRSMLGLLIGGDYTKIKAMVEGATDTAGDYLRTILFGGDNFIESDTLKGAIGKAYIKATIHIDGAISRFQ